MKKRFLSKVLAVLVAVSLTVPAFAEDYIAVILRGEETYDSIKDQEGYEDRYYYALNDYENNNDDVSGALDAATSGDTVLLLKDHEIKTDGIGVCFNESGVTLDLGGNKLTINAANEYEDEHIVGIMGGSGNLPDIEVKNGTIEVNAANAEKAKGIYRVSTITDVELTTNFGKCEDAAAIVTLTDDATLTDCVINAGSSKLFASSDLYGTPDDSKAILNSGSYSGNITESSYKMAEDSTIFSDTNDNKANGLVITSKDTAAVTVDEKGKATLYNDLSDAVEKSNGQPVTVLKADDIAKLEVKEGDKLNLVDAKGNSLNDKVSLGADLVLKDGVVSKVEKPDKPVVTPSEPITPVLPEFPEVMSTPAESATTIADEETPLSGLTTLGELVSYLYTQEGSPDGEDAEGEYTLAMAWAVAKELVAEDADPEEVVTGAILRDVMTAYAELLDTTFDVEVNVQDDTPVMNCDELLTAFFEAQEARTK